MIVLSCNLFIKFPNISVHCKVIVSKNAEKEHFLWKLFERMHLLLLMLDTGQIIEIIDSLIYLASHCFTRASSGLQTWHWGYVNISSPVWRMHLSRTELPWICPVVVCKIDRIRSGSWKVFRAAEKIVNYITCQGFIIFHGAIHIATILKSPVFYPSATAILDVPISSEHVFPGQIPWLHFLVLIQY